MTIQVEIFKKGRTSEIISIDENTVFHMETSIKRAGDFKIGDKSKTVEGSFFTIIDRNSKESVTNKPEILNKWKKQD